ncbi:crotonase/enoyl-CoA hydratase family protein [Nannocystis bainbridge]|uniref:Crotonase/enoyl-CoA hydratase family protein n=1 Tax=Nannocystis bainbridge TaxID=2995303 RepID=A0ABT5E3Q1_9BACT|nr:crotonase/enoyl-CoA hydratase family protein [Nannocystis bainbridge]MDC0719356.1 crotonase/enoyl-CoA hydratase family protein [Nannocystis bainbridge]
MSTDRRLSTQTHGHVQMIGLDRAAKRNAFDLAMLRQLAEAFTEFEDDPQLRCAVVFAHGDHFTAGLDLAEVGPAVARGELLFPPGAVDPLGLHGRVRSKPVVLAVQGFCLTLGIELMLAADIRIAASDARFGQIEIRRGIFPFGGATLRLPQVAGWGNAMRWLLTGDNFDAAEALRIGLVQEVVAPGEQVQRALEIATTIAAQAPLGVRATLSTARTTVERGPEAALATMMDDVRAIMGSDDAREGMQSFVERRAARFSGT